MLLNDMERALHEWDMDRHYNHARVRSKHHPEQVPELESFDEYLDGLSMSEVLSGLATYWPNAREGE